MGSSRKQVNVRVDGETEELMERLLPAVRAALGLPISQSDLFRLGLNELARKYLTTEGAIATAPVPQAPPTRKRRGSRKSRG